MKVVKKCDGRSEHNVLDESTDYYLCGERQGMHPYLLAKKDYEPVEEWVDVDMSTLTFKESEDDAYLCDGVLILFKRTWWANGKGLSDSGEDAETYRITGLQRKVKR